MKHKAPIQKRERHARWFLTLISLIGWLSVGWMALHMQQPENFGVFVLLVGFLFVTEYYPISVWKDTRL